MVKTAVITARLDPETSALVDRIAKAQGRSRSWFAEQAIRKAAEKQAEWDAFVQEGLDAVERGDVVPHEDVMAMLDEMRAKHRARCA